jgi:hypothetical protein
MNYYYLMTCILLSLQATLVAGGHVVYGYAYVRNHTPYTIVLHALQETQWTDKVPQPWFIQPGGMQRLGRVDTLNHVRVTGQFADNSQVPDTLRKIVDIPLPYIPVGNHLMITVFAVNDMWKVETLPVLTVVTQDGGVSGYSERVSEH